MVRSHSPLWGVEDCSEQEGHQGQQEEAGPETTAYHGPAHLRVGAQRSLCPYP